MKNKDKVTLVVATLMLGWVGLSNASNQTSVSHIESERQHSSRFNEQLRAAKVALGNNDEAKINESLEWLSSNMTTLTAQEQHSAQWLMAQFHMTMNEYAEALDLLEPMMESGLMSPSEYVRTLKQAADLAMATEQYEKSNQYWLELLENTTDSSANIRADKLAVNYFMLKDYVSALYMLELAYSEMEDSKQLEQRWLKLQMGIHYELGQIAQAKEVASDIARLYPSESNDKTLREFELLMD